MRFTERDLEKFAYPLNDSRIAEGKRIFWDIVSSCQAMGYIAVDKLINNDISAAAFSIVMQRASNLLYIFMGGGYAKNTAAAQGEKPLLFIYTDTDADALADELLTRLSLTYGTLVLTKGMITGAGISVIIDNIPKLSGDDISYAKFPTVEKIKLSAQKNRATDYSFKKVIRIAKSLCHAFAGEKSACAMIYASEMEELLEQLPTEDYLRYDSLRLKCHYIFLRLHNCIEQKHIICKNPVACKDLLLDFINALEN